jgi:tetratricopeptide (TPR) repeat protein
VQDSWGWYLFVRGRTREAVIELEKAARLKPNEAIILEHLGDAYLRSNLREKAVLQYRDAAKFADEETRRKIESKLESVRREVAGVEASSKNRAPAGTASTTVGQ